MIIIILPAYNEEKSLPKLFPKLRLTLEAMKEDYRIIVCNDGSQDKTGEILKNYQADFPLDILTHKINRGLGETMRDLFERSVEVSTSNDDIIVRLDCDDTHEPDNIPLMVEKIRQGFDVVTASRFQEGSGQLGLSAYRKFISYGATLYMRLFFPIKGLKEYTCGFRAYRMAIIKKAIAFYGNNFIQLKGLGFTCSLEKILKLKLLNATFSEIPFVLRYDQKESDSKMVSSLTTLGYFTMTLLYYWPWGGWRSGYRQKLSKMANDK